MNRFFFCLLIASLFAGTAHGADATAIRQIPLDQVWAYDMPGTLRVRKLESKIKVPIKSTDELVRNSLVFQIHRVLSNRPPAGTSVGPAFVVPGTGSDALKNAADVFTGKATSETTFPPDTDLTLVFYSHLCGQYVWIDSIELSSRRITVAYRFVGHRTADMSVQFALIPLGKMPNGEIEVEIKQLPPTTLHRADAVAPVPGIERLVCESFSFRVGE